MPSATIPGLSEQKTPFSAVTNGATLYFESLSSLKAFIQLRHGGEKAGSGSARPVEPGGAEYPVSARGTKPEPMPGPAPALDLAGSLEELLETHFGYGHFREGQRDVIDALLAGESAVAIMPTGSGKSICYQLPALKLPGLTVVVSPLIALMKDQVEALERRGIAATLINSQLSPDAVRERLEAMRERRYRLVFVAPERFANAAFLASLADVKVSLFAVDEAHCISEWGHNFRPHYLHLARAIAACGHPPVLAATATATPDVRGDIIHQLGLKQPRVVVTGFNRPNLTYNVRRVAHKGAKFEAAVEQVFKAEGPVVVYAATKAQVEAFAARLRKEGLAAVAYHAGLGDAERERAQDEFMSGRARAIVATNAFGMGVDKADVRQVLHLDMPKSVEAYYQEAGRAGRDGQPAQCTLLFADEDERAQRFLIDSAYPTPKAVRELYQVICRLPPDEVLTTDALCDYTRGAAHPRVTEAALRFLRTEGIVEQVRLPQGTFQLRVKVQTQDPVSQAAYSQQERKKGVELDRLDAMVAFASTSTCRRAVLLRYFGEHAPLRCGQCDVCHRPVSGAKRSIERIKQLWEPAQERSRTEATRQAATAPHEGEFNRRRTECPYCFGKVLHEELAAHCQAYHGKGLPAG